jgi:hypothetical protein
MFHRAIWNRNWSRKLHLNRACLFVYDRVICASNDFTA